MAFYGNKVSFLLFVLLLYLFYSFFTFPLEWVECPTVVETCLDLLRWGKFISNFFLCWGEREREREREIEMVRVGVGGGWTLIGLGEWSENFLIGPP